VIVVGVWRCGVGVVIAKGFLMIIVIVAPESPAAGTVVADTAKAGSGCPKMTTYSME